ncbi:MAG: acetylglutamate kinase [Deltaproteobacteria bacterium]|nr:acetylglutamate kinase [Deltaproteobacteria bacterium]
MTRGVDRDLAIFALKAALPYIRLYRGRVFVIKIGGAICGHPAAIRDLCAQVSVLSELGIRVVLVHGGGPQSTALSHKLGLETTFDGGRRVTDDKTLEVVVMTLNGTVNTSILAACRAAHIPAIGLSGIDAGLLRAVRRPPQVRDVNGERQMFDYGLVGDVVGVEIGVLKSLLDLGTLPVISPISADDNGQVLNINADTVAAMLARELKAEKLIFLTDTAGLLEDKNNPATLVSYTDIRGLDALAAAGAVDTGMLPKVKAATEALQGGVGRVHIVGYRGRSPLLVEIFTNEGAGTLIVKSTNELLPGEQAFGGSANGAPTAPVTGDGSQTSASAAL